MCTHICVYIGNSFYLFICSYVPRLIEDFVSAIINIDIKFYKLRIKFSSYQVKIK